MENLLFPILVLLFFATLWIGLQILCCHLGGWALMARTYRCSQPFMGQKWHSRHCRMIRMKWEQSKSSLREFFPALPLDIPDEVSAVMTLDLQVGANDTGLYVASTRLSRPGHAPLFVPWNDIVIIRLRCSWIVYLAQARLGFTDLANQTDACFVRLAIRFRRAPLVVLEVDDRTADLMAEAAGDAWPGFQIVSPFLAGPS